MKYTSFHEHQFRQKVDKALEQVQKILDVTRTPTYAEDQEHTYEDKFALAEFLTNTAIAAQMNVLERMGLDEEKLAKLCDGVVNQDKRSVTLRFAAEESCSFLKEQAVSVKTHEHEYTVESSKQTSGLFGSSKNVKETTKSKVSTKVTEYHWTVSHQYKLYCFAGNQPDKDPVVLDTRTGTTTIVTSGDKKSPIPERTVHPPVDASLTWLLKQIATDKKRSCCFKIDRSKDTCRTPSRNDDIKDAIDFYERFQRWSEAVAGHFDQRIERFILGKHDPTGGGNPFTASPSLHSIDTENIFCPVLPLMETPREGAGTATREEQAKSMLAVKSPVQDQSSSPLLSLGDVDKFLNEQIRSLNESQVSISMCYPAEDTAKLITSREANLYCLLKHGSSLCLCYTSSVGYIENMLRKQLIAAIGKEVRPKDFDDFMQFHTAKLFHADFSPKPFCYSIRRPDHYPDGVVSIEKKSNNAGDAKIEPISTVVRSISGEAASPMYFPINAATQVEFTGARYLHGWIQHRFAASSSQQTTLTARARQFSSFLLMVGTIAGPDKFNPKDAIIVQNKDEVMIPLLLNELPTAKEFKDAIASLSPEQQRFARSFRGMQLESSVFGVCVVQLKPQLEDLLRLPQDSLTKEIQLTQDLLSLFIDYQIPSDLLSYDGPDESALSDKVKVVKEYVKKVQDVIASAKKEQLEEAKRRADMSAERYVARTLDVEEEGNVFCQQGFSAMASEPTFGMAFGGASSAHRRLAKSQGRPMQMHKLAMASPPSAPGAMMAMNAPPEQAQYKDLAVAEMVVNHATEQQPQAVLQGEFNGSEGVNVGSEEGIDFTMIPKELDALFEKHDTDSAIRSTIIESAGRWDRRRQENLLTKAVEASLNSDSIKSEKNKAFDLLDALSRSGSLPISCAELHVIVAITHTFEEDIMGTVIQDNINPIEKVEKTYLMMASKIHGTEAPRLIRGPTQVARLASSFPALFEASNVEEEQAMTVT